ncbi:MAG: DUF2625 domain-containing protein [Candidatus Acidiferrum sp.]
MYDIVCPSEVYTLSPKRAISEFLDANESAWPTVLSWVMSATNQVEILPPHEDQKAQALVDTQVTTRSPMGAIIYHTGGLLVDNGWLRFLGSGHPKLPRSMPAWNQGRSSTPDGKSLGFWLIADDVVGGFFAVNGGAFGPSEGHIFYFSPETLRWESMNGMGYSEFLVWSLGSDLAKFYEASRWKGWKDEVSALSGDQAFSFYPFLWTEEGKDIEKCDRKPIPISEVFSINTIESPNLLRSELASGGFSFRVKVSK